MNYGYNNYYQSTDERIWVQGEGAAQAYLVAPNSFVRLWDSVRPVFYEKRADQTGRPYMETYEYKRVGNMEPEDRLKAIEERLMRLERGMRYESNGDDQTVQPV